MGMKKQPSPPKVGAPLGNQNAVKDDGLDDQTTFRHLKSERAAWMAARQKDATGQPEKLTAWMRRALNQAAGIPPP